MNNQSESFEKPKNLNNNNNFAVIALFVCFLSFSLSVATPWFMGAFAPPPPVAEEVDEPGMTERLLSSLLGSEEDVAEPEEESQAIDVQQEHWTDAWPFTVMMIALGGLFCATIAVLQRQNYYIAGTAIFFGVAAIVIQYIVMAIIVFTILVILVFLLSAIGVEF